MLPIFIMYCDLKYFVPFLNQTEQKQRLPIRAEKKNAIIEIQVKCQKNQ